MRNILVWAILLATAGATSAAPTPKTDQASRKKTEKAVSKSLKAKTEIDFDSHVVEGSASESMYGVVEGSSELNDSGVLDLRENFLEQMAEDAGEKLP